MGYIKINQNKVTKEVVTELMKVCPFNAFEYQDTYLSINAGCRICKLCVRKGPAGVCEFIDNVKPQIDKSKYKGIAVFVEQTFNVAHPVSWELIGKAKELAKVSKEEVIAVIIGSETEHIVKEALTYGVDKVVVYESSSYEPFDVCLYTDVIEDFFKKYQVGVILYGGTTLGRSFAPRVAARLKTGLTADCTMLDIREDGDLLQIRPAFGGNIMASIHTPNHRPQMATIRYKMFNAPTVGLPHGIVLKESMDVTSPTNKTEILEVKKHQESKDISDASIIVAVGRAFKKEKDLELVKPLLDRLGAELACTRPLIENGWMDPRKQIGLSGRTVKPKLIINLGISGSVQYIEGMKESELIISVNTDPNNRLFELSDYAILGDIYEVLPELNLLLDSLGFEKGE